MQYFDKTRSRHLVTGLGYVNNVVVSIKLFFVIVFTVTLTLYK